jgi:zinc protease
LSRLGFKSEPGTINQFTERKTRYMKLRIFTLLITSVTLFAAPSGVSIHKLNNGMDVLLIENKALPMVGVNVVIKTGSAYETYESSGMSHMLEHLLFNGTTTRTQRELYDATDLIGGYNNANTGEYYTNFMMVMPAEHQITGMEIQADMLFNSIMPEEKFKKEQGIVLEEIAQSLSKPATQMDYNLKAELFKGHALSLPTLGTYATIEHMQRDDVWDYYKSTYRPNNMILSAIGNFDTADMLKEITRIYGSAAPGAVSRPRDENLATGFMAGVTPPAPGVWLDRYYGGEVPTLHQIYALSMDTSPEFLALLSHAFKAQLSEMETDLKSDWPEAIEGLSLEIHDTPVARYLELKLNLKQADQARAMSNDLYERVTKAKFRIPSSTLNAMATKERTAFLQNTEKPHMFGIYNAQDLSIRGIDGVLDLPETEDLNQAYQKLKYYRFTEAPAVIFHHPQQVESDQANGNVTTTLVQDPQEGMGLIVRSNPGTELLAVHYLFKYKSGYENEYGKDASKILHDCFAQRMEDEDKTELSQQYGLKFTVNDNPWIPMDNIYLHPDFGYIRAEGLAQDLSGAIRFLNREMNGFVPTEVEYMKAKNKFSKGMMHGNKDQAKDRFDALVDSALFGPKETLVEKDLTYMDLVNFSNHYFAPINRIVSVVSPGTPDEMARLFITIDSKGSAKTFPMTDKQYIDHNASISIDEQGGGERAYLYWGFTKQVSENEKAAIKTLGLILSDRITFDVREKQGLAYRMTATAGVRGDKAHFYMSLGTRPQNVEILSPQFATLMSLKTIEGLTEEDVQKSINMYLGRMMFRRLSSINQAYYLGTSLFFESDMLADEAGLAALSKVTLADVRAVAEKYLIPENTVEVIVR